jgi:hypothetical protein
MSVLRAIVRAAFCAAVSVLARPAWTQPITAAPQPPSATEPDSGLSLGAGFGIPYGGLVGGEAEVVPIVPANIEKLGRYFGVSFGLGVVPSGIGAAFGANVYPWGKDAQFQPRLLFRYGVVGNVEYDSGWSQISGMSLGAGVRRDVSHTVAIEADVLYVAKVFGSFSDGELGSRVKVSAGVRWHPAPRVVARPSSPPPPTTGTTPAAAELGLGLGAGIPFGGVGANFEFCPRVDGVPTEVYDHVGVSVGVGASSVGPGYSVGARGYPLGKTGPLVPRLAAYYGVVALAEYSDGTGERIEGFALGAALLRRFGPRVSAEVEGLYIFPSWGAGMLDSHLKISLGLHARLR